MGMTSGIPVGTKAACGRIKSTQFCASNLQRIPIGIPMGISKGILMGNFKGIQKSNRNQNNQIEIESKSKSCGWNSNRINRIEICPADMTPAGEPKQVGARAIGGAPFKEAI